MSTSGSKAFHTVLPPTAASTANVFQSAVTGNSAAATAIFTGLSSLAPEGKVYVYFEARTTDAYIRTNSSDSSPAVTSNLGILVKADQPGISLWLDPDTDVYVEHIAPSGAGVLKWYVASPEFTGSD